MSEHLARCIFPGCPWRWPSGDDRDCGHHDDTAQLAARTAAFGVMTALPGHEPADPGTAP